MPDDPQQLEAWYNEDKAARDAKITQPCREEIEKLRERLRKFAAMDDLCGHPEQEAEIESLENEVASLRAENERLRRELEARDALMQQQGIGL